MAHVFTLWGGSRFDHHVWRSVIIPPDLAQYFSEICATNHTIYHCHVLNHACYNLYACVLGERNKEKIWWYNNLSPYVIA